MSNNESVSNFLASTECFAKRVEAAPAQSWGQLSPCEGWTARDVTEHVIGNLRGISVGVQGGDFFAGHGQPVDDDIASAYSVAAAGAAEALADDVPETLSVGGNAVPAAGMIDGVMRDIVIHTWDLAQAIGGDSDLPPELVTAATVAMGMVTEALRGPGFYGAEVAAPSGATAQDKLLALSGRSL